jgi:hypothetical protein
LDQAVLDSRRLSWRRDRADRAESSGEGADDAAIGAAQRVEHDKITGYTNARNLAQRSSFV